MTKRATFTQAELMRAVKVADKATKAGIPTKVWVAGGSIHISVLRNAEPTIDVDHEVHVESKEIVL